VAELDCEVENEDEIRRASSCAVPFLFVLNVPGMKSLAIGRQSCAANERSGRGERTGI
jgi:hypothetical protein